MAFLPSYHEATQRPDWLALSAPHVLSSDYASLCLVSRRFWDIFAPRLWTDILTTARWSGLDPLDDSSWWAGFVLNRLNHVAPKTRGLVRVLDARTFAQDALQIASYQDGQAFGGIIAQALDLLPNVSCFLLDGHVHIDLGYLLGKAILKGSQPLKLLSLAACAQPLPRSLFCAPSLQSLVYLDVSALPGSSSCLLQPFSFPNLRILKARRTSIDDGILRALVQRFNRQLWSLDIAENKVTDSMIRTFASSCVSSYTLRSDARFEIEGKLARFPRGSFEHDQFLKITESELSGSFSHPERFLVDAPRYLADEGHASSYRPRADGRVHPRHDTAGASISALDRHDHDPALESFCSSTGLTHLNLSHNRVSSFGIQSLLRCSLGHFESFTCDSMSFLPPADPTLKAWPPAVKLQGVLGASHLFRPVISSNLRYLRIHHSFVTHVPTLESHGLSAAACTLLAETVLLRRIAMAYPQPYLPDMNPRLLSLTLTHIPRRSTGPLIEKLIDFIRSLSVQERAIEDLAVIAPPWRGGPSMLQGLRHLGLEFDPDPMEDGFSASNTFDAEELLNSGEQGFSFFQDERTRPQSESVKATNRPPLPPRSTHGPADPADQYVNFTGRWNDESFTIPVWAGPSMPGSNEVLDAYRRLVRDEGLREGIGPATPNQILAGAPDPSFVFHKTWGAAIMPCELPLPSRDDILGLRDVYKELKAYRSSCKKYYQELQKQAGLGGAHRVPLGEPHYFWTGALKVTITLDAP